MHACMHAHAHACTTHTHECRRLWAELLAPIRLICMWEFDYNLTNYNFRKPLNFNKHIEFHPSGNILILKAIKGFMKLWLV